MQMYPVHANDVMVTISSFKISCLLWHPTAVYLIVMPTLAFLNSHSHQNAADTLVLLRPLPRTLCVLQNLLKTLTVGANQNKAIIAVVCVICSCQFKTLRNWGPFLVEFKILKWPNRQNISFPKLVFATKP